MKVSLNWLNDYVTTSIPPEKLAHKLTMAGLEVEKISTVKGDTVFDLEITPNRPDCLCMLGIARETAAILKKTYNAPKAKKRIWPKQKNAIEISDKKGCARYIGTLIENVSIKKAQENIIKRLEAVGIKSINNVVDITNFCLMETGQPLHAFDYDQLAGGRIIVRRARNGEKIVTIDNIERNLDPSILVIADAKKPVAIAGIMGGKDTEVTSATKNILLESAYFDPVLIRRATRKLGLSSDSSYRFERGVDYASVASGANRAIDLIVKYANGTIAKFSDKTKTNQKVASRVITVSKDWVNNYAGASITTAQFKNILKTLEFKVSSGKNNIFKITVPPFRSDIAEAVDIVEEVARVVGYDNLSCDMPRVKITQIRGGPSINVRHIIRNLAVAQGLYEVITYTMINRSNLDQSNQSGIQSVPILNPLTQDQEIMRPSMLPSLLSVVRSNINRGQKNLKFFEIGKVYTAKGEKDVLSIIMTGLRDERWRETGDVHESVKENVNYYDTKGVIEQTFKRLGIKGENIRFSMNKEACYAAGQGADISVNGKNTGSVGKIDENVLMKWDIKQEGVYFAEVDLKCAYELNKGKSKYKPVSEFPVINRDISLAVKTNITAQDIEMSIRQAAKTDNDVVMADVKFIELHKGKKIPRGHRGLIFSLTYQSRLAKTLRDDEVEQVHNKVCDSLVHDLGAIRR